MGLVAVALVSCTGGAPTTARGAGRTVRHVLPNARGTVFSTAANGDPEHLGIALNDPHSILWSRMSDSAVKVSHGLVVATSPDGESQWPWFPHRGFIDYQRSEVAAGRPPLLMTATYQEKSQPVYWNWRLGFPAAGEVARVTDTPSWQQAINVRDDRYVSWLVATHINPIMFDRYFGPDGRPVDTPAPYPDERLGMDQMVINYHLLGVVDDAGRWVPMDAGPVMDHPFPNSSAALHSAFRHFFAQLHR